MPGAYESVLEVEAGCDDCAPDHGPMWVAANAHGLAAQHATKTGHKVWVVRKLSVRYNTQGRNP